MIRLIIMVFVVGVHTLAWGGGQVTLALGAVSTVFHTSRELFLLLTALVLTYNYGHRPRLNTLRFWRRRYWLVVPAYVTWSAIYYAADGTSRGPFPSAFLHDLLDAGARYHLYFLLVSMQIYLLFPALRWVLRKTEGYHRWLLAAAVAYQFWLTCALHYHLGRPASGQFAQFLNGAGQGYWIDTYVLYVIARAIAGWHFEQLCAFTRRHLGTTRRIALVAAVGVVAGLHLLHRDLRIRRDARQRERGLPAGRDPGGAHVRLGAARRRAAVERPRRAAPEVLRAARPARSGSTWRTRSCCRGCCWSPGPASSAPTAAGSARSGARRTASRSWRCCSWRCRSSTRSPG